MSEYKSAVWIIVAGILLTSSVVFAEGGWIGGGGDPRSMHFAKARIETPEILGRLTPQSLDSPLITAALRAAIAQEGWKKPTESVEKLIAKAKQFAFDKREEIQAEILNSPLKWSEKAHSETAKCAYTRYGKKASEIRLSFTSCIGITSTTDAGRTLIHESVHHLDEKASHLFADLVAIAVYTAWENLLITGIPMCPGAYRAIVTNSESEVDFIDRGNPETLKPGETLHWWNANRHLTGRWEVDFNGRKHYLEFTEDESILKGLRGRGFCAYQAGMYRYNRHYSDNGSEAHFAYPYVLANDPSGQAKIVYFRPRGGDPSGDTESYLISLVRNQTRPDPRLPNPDSDDILYIGGDFPNESWSPIRRKQ